MIGRRILFPILAAAAGAGTPPGAANAAQTGVGAAGAARPAAGPHPRPDSPAGAQTRPDAAPPRFFTPAEYETLGLLCDAILPPDPSSPGARDAGVPWYIDTLLFFSGEEARAPWRHGLEAVDRQARGLFGTPFAQCGESARDRVIANIARGEENPSAPLEHFFVRLKRMVVEAYCYSDAGRSRYLRYRGDAALSEFPGCTHPEHQR